MAKVWRGGIHEKEKIIGMSIEAQVSKHLMKDRMEDYIQFLEELREKMAQCGLTQEILAALKF